MFEAAARHGNFTRAAEELGMTQAAVSYQMKVLEERLGAPLFTRSGRGIVLTEHGRRIAPQVTSAFDSLGEAFSAVRAESEHVLTITAPRTLATNWLAGRLGGFQLERPGLAVRLHVSDDVIDLAAGEADVALRGFEDRQPGMVCHFLMRTPVMPFASPAFLAKYPPVRSVDDLLRMPRLTPGDIWWRLWFKPEDPDGVPPPGVRFDSQILDGSAALAGHGVAALCPLMWEAQIASGQLVPAVDEFIDYPRGTMHLVYPEAKRGLAKIRAFREWIGPEVQAWLGDDPWGALLPPDQAPHPGTPRRKSLGRKAVEKA
ncbi:LysR substrate-binding domain-containing protein [Sphingomonas sp.]|uniref:LysR substrate-binding domain-containing protein n=1 Tax=Sphingomonas sp. TaxID=28214 RepID=UPI0025CEA26C|nr:LysR substrate-binding domain-containing protein [Sphingomonas sp.]